MGHRLLLDENIENEATTRLTDSGHGVDPMATVYPHEEVDGLQKTGREWL